MNRNFRQIYQICGVSCCQMVPFLDSIRKFTRHAKAASTTANCASCANSVRPQPVSIAALLFITIAAWAPAAGASTFTLIVDANFDDDYANAINSSGQVVGYTYFAGGFPAYHAFLYSGGVFTDLGGLGGLYSDATAINDGGQIVGYTIASSGPTSAFLYSGGVVTNLGTLGGVYTSATGINDAGQIVGDSDTATGAHHAFLYSGGVMTDLGTLAGYPNCAASGINNEGQIVGYCYTSDGSPFESFLYSGGIMNDIGGGEAVAINNEGQILFQTTVAGGVAYGINDVGQIVGTVETYNQYSYHPNYEPFLYSGGVLTNLESVCVAPSFCGGEPPAIATDINDAGQIVGLASFSYGNTPGAYAFLLDTAPVSTPEASSLALSGAALLLLIRKRLSPPGGGSGTRRARLGITSEVQLQS